MTSPCEQAGWAGFLKLCEKAKDANKLQKVLELFFTTEEKQMLASRHLIIKALLQDELTQREMAKALGVSIAQITRGSNALKLIDEELICFLQASISE